MTHRRLGGVLLICPARNECSDRESEVPVFETPRQPTEPEIAALPPPVPRATQRGLASHWRAQRSATWAPTDRLHPVGPQVVRGLYLTKQIVEMLKGYRSGDGFYFKVSVPGLDLPLGLELVFRIRLGFLDRDSAGYGFSAEIQVFEPWFPDLNVKHRLPDTAGKLGRGIPPTYTPAPRRDDPWRVWLVLIGDGLILDLARTLADATGTPVDELTARLLALRARGRGETRLANPGWL
jgi:hypothetical protein